MSRTSLVVQWLRILLPLQEGVGAISGWVTKTLHATVVVLQSLSCVQIFETLWTAAPQASLSFTISQNLLKLMSILLVMPSNHLILCCPLLLSWEKKKNKQKKRNQNPQNLKIKLYSEVLVGRTYVLKGGTQSNPQHYVNLIISFTSMESFFFGEGWGGYWAELHSHCIS